MTGMGANSIKRYSLQMVVWLWSTPGRGRVRAFCHCFHCHLILRGCGIGRTLDIILGLPKYLGKCLWVNSVCPWSYRPPVFWDSQDADMSIFFQQSRPFLNPPAVTCTDQVPGGPMSAFCGTPRLNNPKEPPPLHTRTQTGLNSLTVCWSKLLQRMLLS